MGRAPATCLEEVSVPVNEGSALAILLRLIHAINGEQARHAAAAEKKAYMHAFGVNRCATRGAAFNDMLGNWPCTVSDMENDIPRSNWAPRGHQQTHEHTYVGVAGADDDASACMRGGCGSKRLEVAVAGAGDAGAGLAPGCACTRATAHMRRPCLDRPCASTRRWHAGRVGSANLDAKAILMAAAQSGSPKATQFHWGRFRRMSWPGIAV